MKNQLQTPKYSQMAILVFITHDVQTSVKELNKEIKRIRKQFFQ